ncbi:unnamed protein product [Ambrosiozyma monospora]|uniref:Unnamed protein product n=1 Tax=Ambrosiozyma monospora TaxID=43982 RepID=A0ACB5TWZ7_AMBMO|nr:unnamed protein product [Ambrosiozyma monospora]
MTFLQENVKNLESQVESLMEIPPEQLYQMVNPADFQGNLHLVQKTFKGDFEFSVIFNKEHNANPITSRNIKSFVSKAFKKFDDRFIKNFQLSAPFNTLEYVEFAKEIVSQLLGGVSYFYGDQSVDRDAVVDDVGFTSAQLVGKQEEKYELFTSVPSRPFFPRGFYWDEGFHLIPILDYDSDLALDILKSWFSLIDDDGWIAREQILGDEARSKVPAEFVVQNPRIANPPTMMLVFTKMLELASEKKKQQLSGVKLDSQTPFTLKSEELGDSHLENPDLLIGYASEIYPELRKHYEWFRRTQRGESDNVDRECHNPAEIYRWKGRTAEHCLPSGIDDYPRCEADIAELNVDLIAWMGVMTRAMRDISALLGKTEDSKEYSKRLEDIIINMDEIHWSEENSSYCDVTLDDEDENLFECHFD